MVRLDGVLECREKWVEGWRSSFDAHCTVLTVAWDGKQFFIRVASRPGLEKTHSFGPRKEPSRYRYTSGYSRWETRVLMIDTCEHMV